MATGLLFLTGFGPFVDVEENPSGLLVERLDGRALGGLAVHGRVLPVTFDGVGPAYAEGLAELPGVCLAEVGVRTTENDHPHGCVE